MKALGIVLLLAGICVIAYALGMDTTVAAGGVRVHNAGLLSDRQSLLITGAVSAIIGAVFAAMSSRGTATPNVSDLQEQEALQRLNSAVARGDIATVKAFLKTGIDVTRENEWGASPIKVAKSNERTHILALLEAHRQSITEKAEVRGEN